MVLVSGVDEEAMGAAAISLQFGLPDAVGVRHTIDPDRQTLTRIVSDLTGVLEREEIDLSHACVSCAIREDIVPTLERLVPHVTIAAVVAALDGGTLTEDLLGDDLLDERGLATSRQDRRGVAEVACAMVEYSDTVCLTRAPGQGEHSLVTTLARPRVPIAVDPSLLDAPALAAGVHRHQAVEAWVADVRRDPLPPMPQTSGQGAWRLDLRSERPFHPIRFQDELVVLGGGPRRSRGCFWLPTRPDDICVWDAAGGQASVASSQRWGRQQPLTRITVTGLGDDPRRAEIAAAFHRCLLTDEELATRGWKWPDTWDGLEPWLGPIERIA